MASCEFGISSSTCPIRIPRVNFFSICFTPGVSYSSKGQRCVLTPYLLLSVSTTKSGRWKAAVLFLRQLSIMCKGKCQVLHTGRGNPMQHYSMWGAVQPESTMAAKDLPNKKLNVRHHLCPSCMDTVQQYTGLYYSSVANRLKQVIIPLFLALVRPPLKSYVHFWAPSTRMTNWMKSSGGSARWLRGLSICHMRNCRHTRTLYMRNCVF